MRHSPCPRRRTPLVNLPAWVSSAYPVLGALMGTKPTRTSIYQRRRSQPSRTIHTSFRAQPFILLHYAQLHLIKSRPPAGRQPSIYDPTNSILARVVHAYVLCISTPTVRGTPAARRFSKQTQRHVCCDNNPILMRACLRDRDPGRGCSVRIIITGAGGVFSIWGRQRCLIVQKPWPAHKSRRRRTQSRRQ
ncbi:hypothetical protein HYPSUDRAFT_334988 [Hypholoma sublateritium FD-334 SS-4]|uniref:Uncharacterized protein n=1 Tax=Hypholoma sublateritium (strain FD-334 SS-4) TaxID=945553 RepID=A0A0D2LY92_HYPSF|nr:hypothetical protein HYPSUDRAFT_334988 [Hypholoma sublateritium FD-334 SS-4]